MSSGLRALLIQTFGSACVDSKFTPWHKMILSTFLLMNVLVVMFRNGPGYSLDQSSGRSAGASGRPLLVAVPTMARGKSAGSTCWSIDCRQSAEREGRLLGRRDECEFRPIASPIRRMTSLSSNNTRCIDQRGWFDSFWSPARGETQQLRRQAPVPRLGHRQVESPLHPPNPRQNVQRLGTKTVGSCMVGSNSFSKHPTAST